MRIGIAITLSILTFSISSAQDDVMDPIAEKACECLRDMDSTMTKEEMQTTLGLCMLQAAEPYQKQLKKKYKVDLARSDKNAEEFGRMVGFRMASKCPKTFGALSMRLNAMDVEPPPPPPPGVGAGNYTAPAQSIVGKLTSVRSGQFLTLVVLTEDGRTLDFLLLGQAGNVANVLRQPDQGRGATGRWSYSVQELFDPLSRTYRPYYVVANFDAR
ncbi:MAG: hypothetical protein KJZ58_08705 [Flavobacteriales bacterium]|nr:hypothetical protein [Flavobacteriales bacterium]MCL4282334.1 hypothetical protein [Flavobacteriales bacterium]